MADNSNNSSPEVPEKKSTLKKFRKAVTRSLSFGLRSGSSDMPSDSSHSLSDSANGKVSSISVPVSSTTSPQQSPSSVSAPLPTVIEETSDTASAVAPTAQPQEQSDLPVANTTSTLTDIEAEKRIKMLEYGIDDNNKEIQDLREKLKGYEALRNEVESLRKSMETHKNSEISQLRQEIVKTTNEVISGRTDIARYKAEHETLQESIRRLKEEQAVVKFMFSEIQSDLDRENQQMEDCKAENDSPLCAFSLHIF